MRAAVIGIVACIAAPNVTAQDASVPVRAGTAGVSHPRILEASVPQYPPIARSALVSGTVIIEATIDATGLVTGTTIVRAIPLLSVWPPINLQLVQADYEKRLASVRAVIQRLVEK